MSSESDFCNYCSCKESLTKTLSGFSDDQIHDPCVIGVKALTKLYAAAQSRSLLLLLATFPDVINKVWVIFACYLGIKELFDAFHKCH